MPEISEREWLRVGLFWMTLGFLGTAPILAHTWLGTASRWAFVMLFAAHVVEGFFGALLASRSGLRGHEQFWKTLVLGYFSWTKLLKLQSRVDA